MSGPGYGSQVALFPMWSRTTPSSCSLWLACIFSLLWLLGALPESLAAPSGSIRGVVQRDGRGVPEQRIMLVRFGSDQDVQRTPGQTDSQGQFLFENLETGASYTYFVGVRYKEQLYRSAPVTLLDEQQVQVSVDLAEPTTQEPGAVDTTPPRLLIANHLMVLVKRETHLEVREIVRLVNTGTAPYGGAGKGAAGSEKSTFQLYLPAGYYDLSQVQGLAPEYTHASASTLSYIAPIDPGEHRILFSYSLPWRDELTTLLLERTLATSLFDLLVEDQHLMATSDLQFGGQVTIDPHTFVHFRGVNLGPQTRAWVQLTPPQKGSLPLLSVSTYGFIIILSLLGITMPLYPFLRRGGQNTRRGTETDQDGQVQEARELARRLVHDLALLEAHRQAGKITEEVYQQRRTACKDHLCHVVEGFHAL